MFLFRLVYQQVGLKFYFSAPLQVFGEGNYQITAVMEVDTTRAFEEMDESVRDELKIVTF